MSAPEYHELLAFVRLIAEHAPNGGGRVGRETREQYRNVARRLVIRYDDAHQPQLPAVPR